MPKARIFNVQLTPATKEDGVLSFRLMDPNARTFKVEAAGLPDLETKVRALVQNEFKQSAAVYVAVPRGERNPPGFDAATRKYQFIAHAAA